MMIFFVNVLDSQIQIEIALYKKGGCFNNKNFEKLGGILFINFYQTTDIGHRCKYFKNENAINPFIIKCPNAVDPKN